MHDRLRSSFLLLGLVAITAACSSTGGQASAAPSVAPSVAAPSEAPPASVEPPASADTGTGTEIGLADNALGQIVVDGVGATLYGFTPDEGGTPTCYGECATAWPPLVVDDPASVTVAAGLDASKLGSVDRTDGTHQVLYGGWPLYYFANDAAAGATNGQGLGEKWFVVDAAGALIGQ